MQHSHHSPQSLQPALGVPQRGAQQQHPLAVQGVPHQVEFLQAPVAHEDRSEVLTAGAGQPAPVQPATDPHGEKRPGPGDWGAGGGTELGVLRPRLAPRLCAHRIPLSHACGVGLLLWGGLCSWPHPSAPL